MSALDVVALVVMLVITVPIRAVIVALGTLPREIARKRCEESVFAYSARDEDPYHPVNNLGPHIAEDAR